MAHAGRGGSPGGKVRAVSDDISIPSPGYRPPRHTRAGLDPETKRRLIIAGSLAGALAVMVAGYMAIGGRRGGDVPVITADERPIRVKPDNPGGLQVAGVNNELFSENGDNNESKLAAPAETPNPNALRTAPPAPAPKPAAEAPRAVPVAPPAAKPVPAPQAAAPQPAPRVAQVETPKPAATPAPAPAARPTPAPTTAQPAAKPATGKVSIQLAAVGSEQAAKNEWASLAKKMPDLLGSRAPLIVKAERDGKTFWRVRTAGFADAAEARAFCDKVKAKGGACTVAEF